MSFRFTIQDRNGVITEVDEPVGFDANTCEITRDPDWHGIFFNNTGNEFEFYGSAMRLLKDEYEKYGVEGDMTFIIEEQCNDDITYIISEIGDGLITEDNEDDIITEDSYDKFVEFSRGQFVFSKYEFYASGCYVKIPVEATDEIMQLRNRVDQKVNLDSQQAFDEVTNLAFYDKLPFSLLLPSKGIELHNDASLTVDKTENVFGAPDGYGGVDTGMMEIPMDDITSSEIGGFYFETDPLATSISPDDVLLYDGSTAINPLIVSPVVNYDAEFPNWKQITGPINFSTHFSGTITNLLTTGEFYGLNQIRIFLCRLPKNKGGDILSDYEFIYVKDIYVHDNTSNLHSSIDFDFSYTDSEFILNEGDRIYLFMSVFSQKDESEFDEDAYSIKFNAGGYWNMETLSKTDPSVGKVYAVNEAISRIAESITDDKLRAYSEYFGRTDSKPYAVPVDGCGGLEVITNGLRVRASENIVTDQPTIFSLSLKDIFNGLNPIHNIGMGVEPDINRTGFNRLRVEPWQFFYDDTVIMSCVGINNITLKADDKKIYSSFQFGYNKWEAEQYTGLDEFLTKRGYRLTLSEVNNNLNQISTFISSGYALEVTRRVGNNNSKDWRYDNDTFIICLKRSGFTVSINQYSITVQGSPMFALTNGETITFANAEGINGDHTVSVVFSITSGKVVFACTTSLPAGYYENVDISVNGSHKAGNTLAVELGNIEDPENIIDPDSIYNFRISPIRMALRWLPGILQSYRKFTNDSKIIFTDGDGNYYAKGKIKEGGCILENNALGESDTLNKSVYQDANDAFPLMEAETVTFDFPMNSRDYKALLNNPRGLIYYEQESFSGYGWIDSIHYAPKAGLATFNLIPKYTN